MIGIVDYGMGNLRSVVNALTFLGAECAIVADPSGLAAATHLILPGVGAFPDGMKALKDRGLVGPLMEEVFRKQKPFFGICLGMQLLADIGYEHGGTKGLGWVRGAVTRIVPPADDRSTRVPHIGWNDVRLATKVGMYAGLSDSAAFYFVHSYRLEPGDPGIVNGWCDHSGPFAASFQSGNIWATQYHPEKSHHSGLTVLRNFLRTEAAA
jgi:imidazole glycerol-phosphate synthase subunit HisH